MVPEGDILPASQTGEKDLPLKYFLDFNIYYLSVIEEILENCSQDMKEAVEDPEAFNFRRKDPDIRTVLPETEKIDAVEVDVSNRNVRINYNYQEPEERWICVRKDNENSVSIIENYSTFDYRDTKVTSKTHYLVKEEKVHLGKPQGYVETVNKRPLDVAKRFEDMYRKAVEQEVTEENQEYSRGLDPVPPPEQRSF